MRIRTIKPEWLDDEQLAACDDTARLLSVALILLADDHGNGRAAPMFIAGRVWMYHGADRLERAKAGLEQLADTGFIQLYEVRGQLYYAITNWKKHQRVDKPSKPHVPAPDLAEHSRDPRETLASVSGKARESLVPDQDQDQDPDPDQENEQEEDRGVCTPPRRPRKTPPAVTRAKAKAELSAFLSWFNERNGRRFRVRDQLVDWTRKLLSKGYGQDDFRIVAELKRIEWGGDPEMSKYVQPATLLRPNNFERYIDVAREQWEKQQHSDRAVTAVVPEGEAFDMAKVLGMATGGRK